MMVLVLEDDFEFFLVTFHWCQSSTTSLMICPNLNFLPLYLLHRCSLDVRVLLLHLGLIISTLENALANIHRDVFVLVSTLEIALSTIHRDVLVLLDVADVHQCSKVDFPYLLFLCVPSLWLPFIPFPLSFLHLESTLLGCERSFMHTSRFPEACVSERQISRVFWTIRNSRFPKFADQNHIRSSYFFLPRFTLESISHSPDFKGYLKNFVS